MHALGGFSQSVMTFGASNFLAFLLQNIVQGLGFMLFDRVYLDKFLHVAHSGYEMTKNYFIKLNIYILPKYLTKSLVQYQIKEEKKEKDRLEASEHSDSIEPILESYTNSCNDTLQIFFFPYFVILLMQYRNQIGLAALFNIRTSNMIIYLYYQLSLIFFQPLGDVFIYGQLELFYGWKIYEYLIYSRYRFLQRETRWKGLEDSLDECIEESYRRLDQMCFSSQYYFMQTIQFTAMVYILLGFECWLRANIYSPFSDTAFPILLSLLICIYLVLEYITMFLFRYFKIWKTKHEETDWHQLHDDLDDAIDIPNWEEIKGSNDQVYLMNQRLTSETFRYKFLNYNKSWLVSELPQILTPRTLRRSRPYLISQLARIITTKRDDISDDSDSDEKEATKGFKSVALTAASRGIIRKWLSQARRRLKFKESISSLIRKGRELECEQCLSKRQLRVECETDIDKMAEMYDAENPDDEELNLLKWKAFWTEHQKYHTLCLLCLTKRKEEMIKNSYQAGIIRNDSQGKDTSFLDTLNGDSKPEEYPDWGPVFLSVPSQAILLTWLDKAKAARKSRRENKTKSKSSKSRKSIKFSDEPEPWSIPAPSQMTSQIESEEFRETVTPSTRAIATKWTRTARARLQKRMGNERRRGNISLDIEQFD
jgi:hypothetical protein